MTLTKDTFELPVNFHQGKILAREAKNYGTLRAAVEEVNQNGIDAGATQIHNEIDLKRRFYRISDNGTGASREKIAAAFDSVGDTLKSKEKFGKFGLGLFATIAIADEFDLFTCPETRQGNYTRYTFKTAEIVAQKFVKIIGQGLDLVHNPNGAIWWRTQIHAKGLTKDHRKTDSTAEDIAESLSLKFGEAILKRKIKITIDFTDREGKRTTVEVQPREFTGEPLEQFTASRSECGQVELTLFTARLVRGGRKGEVTFGTLDNPSRITWKQFHACTLGLLDANVSKALSSGTFEGVALCERITLHEDRTRFEDNEALLELCEVLKEWFEKLGKNILLETTEQDADTRFQQIGLMAMPYAEMLMKQAEFQGVFSRISIGSVGTGHAKVPKKQVLGVDSGTSIATSGNPFGDKKPGENGRENGGGKTPKSELPGHRPGFVYGDKGKRRTEVKGGSTGLRFAYIEGDDFRVPFEYEPETGTLSFNIRNPNWGQCQATDAYLKDYHMEVITAALNLETFRDATGQLLPELIRFTHESLIHQTFKIMHGDPMMGVEQPKKKKK